MPGVFRRSWFPPRRTPSRFSPTSVNCTVELTGFGATTDFGSPTITASVTRTLAGLAAPTSSGTIIGDHPATFLTGVGTTTSITSPIQSTNHQLFGVSAYSQINTDALLAFRDVQLTGVSASAVGFFISGLAAGGGGGGASGPSGPGLRGLDGAGSGIGGAGGAGDNGVVPGPTVPGDAGLSGTEFAPGVGVGSGGAGASFGTHPGGNGGQYGGGGGGGTGGGHGVGGDGVIVLKWLGAGAIWKTIVLRVADNVNSPLIMPEDWSNTNFVYMLSAGGCGSDGTPVAGGNGGAGGSLLWGPDVGVFSPAQVIPYHIPAGCELGGLTFGDYAVDNGGNATTTASGLPGTHYTSFPGGQFTHSEGGSTGYSGVGLGGGGGSIFAFQYHGSIANPFSVHATAQVGTFTLAGVPADRVFIVGGQIPEVLPQGIAMYPTSDTINFDAPPYVIGSSQFYTVGQVSWGGDVKEQGVDWELVAPFSHIVNILTPPAGGTPIELVYTRWDIGVTNGFQVTAYPVPFLFVGTSIVAEAMPAPGDFFLVNFVRDRMTSNPQTFFARHHTIVDDMWPFHGQYDEPFGFETYRPTGYQVLDLAEQRFYTWDGTAWMAGFVASEGTLFYVKRLRGIYQMVAGVPVLRFRAGDLANPIYPEALTYPPYGDGIGKNLLVRAFAPDAEANYPAAYEVSLCPGDFDPWVVG